MILLLDFSLFALLCLLSLFQGAFEGTLSMRATHFADGDSAIVTTTISYRPGKLAAEVKGPTGEGSRFILREDLGIFWIIMDGGRQGLEFPLNEGVRALDTQRAPGAALAHRLTKNAKVEQVLGRECETWQVEEKSDGRAAKTARAWTVDDMGPVYGTVVRWFDQLSMDYYSGNLRWEHELAGRGLFPLKIERYTDGELTSVEEVTEIERGAVPDSVFAFPAGYARQVVPVDSVMRSMGTGTPAADSAVTPK